MTLVTRIVDGLLRVYEGLVLDRPLVTLSLVALVIGVFAWYAPDLRLDVSADSLILENDADLAYYRGIRADYGGDSFVIVTFSPKDDLFSPTVLAALHRLSDELRAMERVGSVTSILDVPLMHSPAVPLDKLATGTRTLSDPGIDIGLARRELTDSPLYSQRLMSKDGLSTALQVSFREDPEYRSLRRQQDELLSKKYSQTLSADESADLERVSARLVERKKIADARQDVDIARIRGILSTFRGQADIHLGGAPMIVTDMLHYIRHDMVVFGVSVLAILTLLLALLFQRPRWVLLPLMTAAASALVTVGFLGMVGWPVTVVSSNFLALLLIFSLSLVIHLIVRYRELHCTHECSGERDLVRRTLRSKAAPSFFTVITTMIAFASLVVSDIRPVIDFGWIMVVSLAVSFVFAFTLFPATLMLLNTGIPGRVPEQTDKVTHWFACLVENHGVAIVLGSGLLLVASMLGMSRLSVENRFIDYFHESTEIFKGMLFIDRQFGGTTPLEVIIDAPPPEEEQEPEAVVVADVGDGRESDVEDDFDDDFDDEDDGDGGITATSYWFNSYMLERVAMVHKFLQSAPDIGKVLSLHTTIEVLKSLDDKHQLDDFFLALLYKNTPEDIKRALIYPYLSADGNQVRFSLRIHDANPALQRNSLLEAIESRLIEVMGYAPEQVHLTGMMVLYNNLLQSLFRSQILTLGAVFLAILLTFMVLFRSPLVAVIGIIPNLLAASMVLGLIGALGIPLDIMTITIAAITIGIGVDDTIHYIHRYHDEWRSDHNYWLSVRRAHLSIGRAMYYTSLIITVGFMVMVLSEFIPTVYFGLFTAFAMISALLANLTLLPMLLKLFKPYGPNQGADSRLSIHSRMA